MDVKCINQEITDSYAIYNGDCCEVIRAMPDDSVGMSVFSPPFADLYSYSNSDRDMGNCKDYDEFFTHFGFLVGELFRVTKPGRIVAVHCMDIPLMKERDGVIGIRDFTGDIIRCFQSHGFVYHSRTMIWKCPLIEATRTKALGLMHKQLCKDSTRSRSGLPDYLVAFRKDGENAEPVIHPDGLSRYAGKNDPGGHGIKRSHNIWRQYASPVWMDIRQSHTLNKSGARDENDEKHICPLQLDVIERALVLWSNPGETVLTPFMGVGSEVYGSLINGRRAIGIELKESYYRQAVSNCRAALECGVDDMDMFAGVVE
jgi:DNA modification methylase